ncbi:hypothetical protein [Acetobacter syzygii]|uniref:DUF1311 domain-containing protein n=1 Tax=Acetobacter syzygii TaxID=146476 RepID=A0A270BA42_9PROT|nr:hypothetical protein [Acetobacter syzygii]PAL21046.1 hypothetical protein B9K05_11855 [Acetobacter syzygii]PAL23377.1 hypothetical protein B9K04_11820 [Acetobacter syzygii]
MRHILAALLLLAPMPAYAGKAKQARLQMEADIAVCNQQFPIMRGNMARRAQCIGTAQLKRDAALGANPQPTIAITNKAIEVWGLVDQGRMSPQDASQQIQTLGASLQAQQNYENKVREDREDEDRRHSIGQALQNAARNYQNSLQTNQVRPSLNCTTMPIGAGQTTTHCY